MELAPAFPRVAPKPITISGKSTANGTDRLQKRLDANHFNLLATAAHIRLSINSLAPTRTYQKCGNNVATQPNNGEQRQRSTNPATARNLLLVNDYEQR